ncbi:MULTISPECIES: helix-turn-helix domain-containing protein [Enterobacterales]|uniref:XRE family transcriptional regulator n=1 Tax=Cronobacter sakazakii TaxID=28141 RepID=A0AA44Z6G1_CROSK|nr:MULTISPECIES: helix-turn-helix transcriptional regulator [Enterobacterales]EKM0439993.1 helix-turn-helix transcriptional regulator [Cronobacter turicensis]PUW01554.1 XRE family transcriptional regulator [Cronobacter sakazakii]PXV70898.1 regulatory Fis family protein [Pantoea sp. PNA 03-3]WRU16767.1 helix-turn-helix transcriptional regulator [Cronobacter malonaticus]
MTGFDLILWRRGLNWNQERAASELGISRTSLVKYEDGAAVPRTVQLATVALTLKAEWPAMKNMNKDKLLHLLKYEVMRTQDD